MIKLLRRLSPVRTDPYKLYPDLEPLRRSVKGGDWNAVSTFFDGLPARSDRSVAVRAVAGTHGSEQFLQRTVDAERDSSLARTLLGARLIVMAWDARGRQMARFVKEAQWRVFLEHVQNAERVLADATAIDPANAAAWTERVVTARALSLSTDEARRRYDRAAEHCDVPYLAQTALVQNLCPKWGGTLEAVQAFARECLERTKPGTLGGAIVADAHVEQAFTEQYFGQAKIYLRLREVLDEVGRAAEQTVLHPDFDQTTHGSVTAHATFAYVYFLANDPKRMAPHFAALGNRICEYPWHVVFGNRWKDAVRAARRDARRW